MATQLQLRRGTTAENNAFTGAIGEVTVDTDTNALRVHDGSTTGGFMVDTVVAFQAPTAQNDYTWYRKYADGWVEQGGLSTKEVSISLPVTMSDTNYTATAAFNTTANDYVSYTICVASKTTTTILLKSQSNIGSNEAAWRVEGMAAQGA